MHFDCFMAKFTNDFIKIGRNCPDQKTYQSDLSKTVPNKDDQTAKSIPEQIIQLSSWARFSTILPVPFRIKIILYFCSQIKLKLLHRKKLSSLKTNYLRSTCYFIREIYE